MNLLLSVLSIVVVCGVKLILAAVPLFGLIFCLFLFIVQVQVISELISMLFEAGK